jgi:membrane protein YqaA with SNARE-associated domain
VLVSEPFFTYAALFGWSFLAATILPLGSEPALFAMVARGYSVPATVTIATAGNYLGACTTYWVGRGAASVLEARHGFHTSAHGTGAEGPAAGAWQRRAAALVSRWGQPVLILSWVPLIGDALVAAAGMARMPLGPFSFWVILGKALRYVAVAWGASTLRF